jgi:uncharacterized phage protein gp47/JayE
MNVDAFAVAPTLTPVNITINLTPNTTATRQAVTAAIADLFYREAAPGLPASTQGTLRLSRLREVISLAVGEAYHQLIAPVADVSPTVGALLVPGTITFT